MQPRRLFFRQYGWLPGLLCLFTLAGNAQKQTTSRQAGRREPYSAYLFTYFTGNGPSEEAIRFATSPNGFNYKALNDNQPVLKSADISESGGVRDPHILRGDDGKTFYMVATDMNVAKNGWGPNTGMVLMRSSDLIHWQTSKVHIPTRYPQLADVNRVWAPQTIYDPVKKKYMLYWSMRFGNGIDKVYYAYANAAFTDLETTPEQLFTSPTGGSSIDTDIIRKGDTYFLFYKTEGAGNGIKQLVSKQLTGPYQQVHNEYLQQTKDPVEGAGVFKLINSDRYILMYDVYTKGRYEFTESTDLTHFKKVDGRVSMNFTPRHGTVIPITAAEEQALRKQWHRTNNPVLGGYFADPEILYAQKTGKFYLYPTSDGFDHWSGTYFKTFSSDNLVDWQDEGTILTLGKDVSWANRNAWAPCIVEKKVNGEYKYVYYFTAAQKIGVATADNPTGPFTDSGKPLIDSKPAGINGGQEIDPDVFTDPKTGRSYLYWGNGYMAGAELNDDMVSLKPGTQQVMTPDKTFREGTYVIYRNGTYYFFWSEDDTRSPNYRVRYGTSDSPLGKITVPANNVVLEQDKSRGIYGAGHNSVVQLPGHDSPGRATSGRATPGRTNPGGDEWYIVYHRFNYPNGINMGESAGYHRETCIDKLEFNVDGSIKKVQPTLEGIKPVSLTGRTN